MPTPNPSTLKARESGQAVRRNARKATSKKLAAAKQAVEKVPVVLDWRPKRRGEALQPIVQAFIVQSLACFMRPCDVVRQVKEIFDIDVTIARVRYYDPTQMRGWGLAPDLRALFEKTRASYNESVGDLAVFNLRARGEVYEQLLEQYMAGRPNGVMALKVLEQAAKDQGGLYRQRVAEMTKQGTLITPAGGQETPDGPRWDLTKLTTEELEELQRLGKKCAATPESQDLAER